MLYNTSSNITLGLLLLLPLEHDTSLNCFTIINTRNIGGLQMHLLLQNTRIFLIILHIIVSYF